MRIPRSSLKVADSRGHALIEFSTCFLLFVILLFGVIEVGRMILLYTTVANAAKTGVRYAIVNGSDASSPSGPGNDPTNVTTVVKNFAGVYALNPANLTVHATYYTYSSGTPTTPACNKPGCWVRVTASYPYDPLTSWVPFSFTLSSTSEGVITF